MTFDDDGPYGSDKPTCDTGWSSDVGDVFAGPGSGRSHRCWSRRPHQDPFGPGGRSSPERS
jgi:hypothetical protein